MNIKCTIIEDLLPLYVDGICSADTKEMVETHLKECESCNQKYINMTNAILAQENISEKDEQPGDFNLRKEELVTSFTAKKAFKKLRRRFIALILLILFLIPNIYLGINQFDGEGISYTNLGIFYKANSMLSAIKKGNYEKAFTYLDMEGRYRGLTMPDKTEFLDDIYTLITINDTDYYVNEETKNNFDQYKADNDELSFWRGIYLSDAYIIPQDKYNRLLEENPEISDDNSEKGNKALAEEAYKDSGNGPELISSTYGNYYIPYHYNSGSAAEDGTETLIQMAYSGEADILPVKVYETALEQEEKDEEEQAKIRQTYIDMGYENYYTSCKNNFIANMKRLSENGIIIGESKLKYINRMYDDRYQLDYDIIFKVNETKIRGFGLTIQTSHNKLQFVGSYYETGKNSENSEKLDDQYHLSDVFNIISLAYQ